MVEPAFDTEAFHARMIAMAGKAILLQELLMEWRAGERFLDRLPKGRELADLFRLVAGRAALSRGPEKRCVAGKAVRFELAVAWNQLTGADHQMGIDEGKYGQGDQVGRQNDLEGLAHRHPQNRKMLMM